MNDVIRARLSADEWDETNFPRPEVLAGDPATGRIERFLTGPNGCEVTGLCWSADRRTMFVGIQHPSAPFPDGEGKLPRSSIIAIKRDDKAYVG
jgi:secreted PhoX family phosphatase